MSDASSETKIPPVQTVVEVPLSPAEAFRAFTRELDRWWPLATHSVGQAETEHCAVEGQVGGRIYERTRDGEEHLWGTIRSWRPDRGLVFSWHPGRDAAQAQEVEVSFAEIERPETDGQESAVATRIELEHRGWESLGEEAAATRDGYESGWEMVLGGRYGDYCRSR